MPGAIRRRLLWSLFLVALVFAPARLSAAQANSIPPVDSRVWGALERAQSADVLVLLAEQPDLGPAELLPSKEARGAWVYQTLRAAADRSQAPLVAKLERAGVPYRRFWVVNAVQAIVTPTELARLMHLPGVARIVSNEPVRGLMPEVLPSATGLASLNGTEWGVNRVNAPWAWSQGYTGQGIVVAGQDTGYAWQHPALIDAYRGYDRATGAVDHDYNWHDSIHSAPGNPCGANTPAPCDDHGHGTHTMGTMVGNDLAPGSPGWPAAAANAIGVAPGARWIGCRNMNDGNGTPASYIECFEWFIAPYPVGGSSSQGDPAKAPDVMNNSWGCPPSEGCTPGNLAAIEPALNAADAAGIVVVVSAGNAGSLCGSVDQPPAVYPKAFSVGATTSTDALAGFSSRGPVTYGGLTYIKPDVSAPGQGVRSSWPGNSYEILSGTSMAGPHVVGVIALLLSAQPALRGQTGLVRAIVERTADPRVDTACGADPSGVPNNGYGWGIVNARRAIESLQLAGNLVGSVVDAANNSPWPGAPVIAYPMTHTAPISQAVTGGSGDYRFALPWGSYGVQTYVVGFDPAVAAPLYAVGGMTTTVRLALTRVPIVTDQRIAPAPVGVSLAWTNVTGAQGYEVWRSADPYFVPGASDSLHLGDAAPPISGTATGYSDGGAVGEPGLFYVVRTVSAAGGRSFPSNRVGLFSYALNDDSAAQAWLPVATFAAH